jgi:hypothetical protein
MEMNRVHSGWLLLIALWVRADIASIPVIGAAEL